MLGPAKGQPKARMEFPCISFLQMRLQNNAGMFGCELYPAFYLWSSRIARYDDHTVASNCKDSMKDEIWVGTRRHIVPFFANLVMSLIGTHECVDIRARAAESTVEALAYLLGVEALNTHATGLL